MGIMGTYRCIICGAVFDEPHREPAGYFLGNLMIHEVCPECREDCFEEMEVDIDDVQPE